MFLGLIEKYILVVSKLEYKHKLNNDEIMILVYKTLFDLQLPIYINSEQYNVDKMFSNIKKVDDFYNSLSTILYNTLIDNLNLYNNYLLSKITIRHNVIEIYIRSLM